MKAFIIKKILVLILMLPILCLAEIKDSIYHEMDRSYYLHLPKDYSEDTSYSLVIAMHGGFGSGAQLEVQSQLSVKADEAKFIVVYPDGFRNSLGIRTWNAGGCCGSSITRDIDDVGFLNLLIDTLIANYEIDTNRIYATGMSNGGYMSYRLACESSHRIAAIAPVSSAMSFPACDPTDPVAIIHFQSKLDDNVPYEGGIGNGVSDHYSAPYDSTIGAWAYHNNCALFRLDSDEVQVSNYYNCDCDASIAYYLTEDGGHSWHGGVKSAIGDDVSALSANDLMWNFFLAHPKCNDVISDVGRVNVQAVIEVYYNLLGQAIFEGTFEEASNQLAKNQVYITKTRKVYFID